MKKFNPYIVLLLLLDIILPAIFIFFDHKANHLPLDPALVGKWVLFFSVGVRLFIAGLVQTLVPEFTATKIFKLKHMDAHVVIRELGFANLSFGIMGMLTLLKGEWRGVASVTAAVFFGLAGIQHLMRKPDSVNEIVALITDLLIFVIMLLYCFFIFFT
jgi:hypothetical protein